MKLEAKAALPNAMVLLMDFTSGVPPSTFEGNLVSSTDTCVAVGTRSEFDGKTTMTVLSGEQIQLPSNAAIVFDGRIRVGTNGLSLVNSLNVRLLSIPWSAGDAHVVIWANDPLEPDCLWFKLDTA